VMAAESVHSVSGWQFNVQVSGCWCSIILAHRIDDAML